MNFSSHLFAALIVFCVFFFTFHLDFFSVVFVFLLVLAGALVPDIDAQQGKLNNAIEQIFVLLIAIFFLLFIVLQQQIFLLFLIACCCFLAGLWTLKHRGFFHSLVFAFLVFMALWLLTNNYFFGLAFVIGFVSHKVLDFF